MGSIAIISGTDRPGSYALKVSRYIKRRFDEIEVESTIIDLQQFPIVDVAGGKYNDDVPSVKKFIKPFLDADGAVFVIPEYNGSFPGILKLFIDYLPFPSAFKGLPIAFVGEAGGAFGALRAVEQMQMVAAYRMAYMFPERVFINRVKDNFDPEGGPKEKIQAMLMDNLINGFPDFVVLHKKEFSHKDQ